jgi:hypothetical protein
MSNSSKNATKHGCCAAGTLILPIENEQDFHALEALPSMPPTPIPPTGPNSSSAKSAATSAIAPHKPTSSPNTAKPAPPKKPLLKNQPKSTKTPLCSPPAPKSPLRRHSRLSSEPDQRSTNSGVTNPFRLLFASLSHKHHPQPHFVS